MNTLVGAHYGDGLYVFQVPDAMAACSESVQDRAQRQRQKSQVSVDRLRTIDFWPAKSLGVTVPKSINALTLKQWSVVGQSASKPIKLAAYVSAFDNVAPCWVLATESWQTRKSVPATKKIAVVTNNNPLLASLVIVDDAMQWDKVTESITTEFQQIVSEIPPLAVEIKKLFTNPYGRLVPWRVVSFQKFSARFQAQSDTFVAVTLAGDSDPLADMVVNTSKKQLCYWSSPPNKEASSSIKVNLIAQRPSKPTDWWVVKSNHYESSEDMIVFPVEKNSICTLAVVLKSGYSGL